MLNMKQNIFSLVSVVFHITKTLKPKASSNTQSDLFTVTSCKIKKQMIYSQLLIAWNMHCNSKLEDLEKILGQKQD